MSVVISVASSGKGLRVSDWDIHAYKAQLDTAIKSENWERAERVRVAIKHGLLAMASRSDPDEVGAVRDALADSFDKLRLDKGLRIVQGALSTATRLEADAETAGIAIDVMPLPAEMARGVGERILALLGGGNRRPMTTTELSEKTGHRLETIARTIGKLRAEKKINSRRIGRNVLHRLANQVDVDIGEIVYNIDSNRLRTSSVNDGEVFDKFIKTFSMGHRAVNNVSEILDRSDGVAVPSVDICLSGMDSQKKS